MMRKSLNADRETAGVRVQTYLVAARCWISGIKLARRLIQQLDVTGSDALRLIALNEYLEIVGELISRKGGMIATRYFVSHGK